MILKHAGSGRTSVTIASCRTTMLVVFLVGSLRIRCLGKSRVQGSPRAGRRMTRRELRWLHRVSAHAHTLTRNEATRVAILRRRLEKQAQTNPQDAVALAWILRVIPPRSPRRAFALLQRAAAQNQPVALLELADRALVKRQTNEGIRLLRRASRLGSPAAMVRLAQMFLYGHGVSRSLKRAEDLLQSAWELGEPEAALWLGLKRDFFDRSRWSEAALWYAPAAHAGNAVAMVNYAVCIERGLGVRRRPALAARWYARAASLGDKDAKRALRRLSRG